MATILTVNSIKAGITWSYENVNALGNIPFSGSLSYNKTLANGTGSGNATKIYAAQTSIANAGVLTLDLDNLTDVFGNALQFAKVKVVYVEVTTTTNDNVLELTGDWFTTTVLSGTTPKVKLRAGGCFQMVCTDATGYAVTASTGDEFTLTNTSSSSMTVNICLIGE